MDMRVRNLSPSHLTVLAAGMKPDTGTPAATAGFCALCGTPHAVGDPVAPFQPTASFTNMPDLADRTATHICRWCDVMVTEAKGGKLFTQKYQKTVVTTEGVFRAASNEHLAYWFRNPPAGPWLFLQGDQQKQHLVWRAPVNWSREVYQVRAGETLLTLRTATLLDSVEAVKRILAALNTNRASSKRVRSPFRRLSRNRDELDQGALSQSVLALAATSPGVAADAACLKQLLPGELWALTALMYAEPKKPEPETRPHEPIIIN